MSSKNSTSSSNKASELPIQVNNNKIDFAPVSQGEFK